MAHLLKCWCGKTYRCDIEHPVRNVLVFDAHHEYNCPDQSIHGFPSPVQEKDAEFINMVEAIQKAHDEQNRRP